MASPCGLLLLTGGQGRRFGGPKHLQPHPSGGTWGGHLVRTFQKVFPEGPVQLLGAALPDFPELVPLEDPRQGPAAALRWWASRMVPGPPRWWVVACDQPHWDADRLEAWWHRARAVDPEARAWVLARVEMRMQFLGGFLSQALLAHIARSEARSLWALHEQLPHLPLEAEGPEWTDVDQPVLP